MADLAELHAYRQVSGLHPDQVQVWAGNLREICQPKHFLECHLVVR